MVFRDARWINHPARTYAAENKPLQLATAATVGLDVPRTRVANNLPAEFAPEEFVAVKALDSFLMRLGDQDRFFYTLSVQPSELTPDACQEIEAHLAGCPPCIEFAESLRQTVELCRRYRPDELPEPLGKNARAQLLDAYQRMLGARKGASS